MVKLRQLNGGIFKLSQFPMQWKNALNLAIVKYAQQCQSSENRI